MSREEGPRSTCGHHVSLADLTWPDLHAPVQLACVRRVPEPGATPQSAATRLLAHTPVEERAHTLELEVAEVGSLAKAQLLGDVTSLPQQP